MVQDEITDADPPPPQPGRRPRRRRLPLAAASRLRRRRAARLRPPAAPPWERAIVRSIAVITMTGALLTYVAVKQDESAVAADQLAVLQTAQVRQQQTPAHIQVHAEAGAAARYRRLLAEAEALEQQAADAMARGNQTEAGRAYEDARLLRATGDNLAFTFDPREFDGLTASDPYDRAGRLDVLIGFGQFSAVPGSQPASTAALADARHVQSQITVACVAGLLAVLVLLSVARLVRVRWRPWLLGVAATGYLAVTVLAAVNGMRDVVG